MKKLIAFFIIYILLIPSAAATSTKDNSAPTYLSRGEFIQYLYETHLYHGGLTIGQEYAQKASHIPGLFVPGGPGTYFCFDDVNSGFLYDATTWAYQHDISNGTGMGEYLPLFSPEREITIQEALTMAYRLIINGGNHSLHSETGNASPTPEWAQDAIRWWTAIDPEQTAFVPTNPCKQEFVDKLFVVIYDNYTIRF